MSSSVTNNKEVELTLESVVPKNIDQVNQTLIICSTIMLIMYTMLIAAVLHNMIRYVVIGKRYNNFHITYFYVLVSLCITFRVIWLSFILKAVVFCGEGFLTESLLG